MNTIPQVAGLSGFTARQLIVLTLLVTLVMVGICALWLGWLAWLAGLPPAAFAFAFIQEVAVPVSGAVFQLSMVGLCFATVACFGRWCLNQTIMPSDQPLQLRMPRFVATNLKLNLPINSLSRILLSAPISRLLLRADSRVLTSTSADLAGAAPLLN